MTRVVRLTKVLVWVGVCAAAVAGCKKDKKGDTASAADEAVQSAGPKADYQTYAPLPKAMTDTTLPVLLDENGVVDVPCFNRKSDITTQTASMEIKAEIEKKKAYLHEVLGRWILDDLAPSGITEDEIRNWEFGVEYPVMVELDPLSLRFVEDQECIQETSGWLESGVRAATLLVGARNFTVTSSVRLTIDQQGSLEEALKEKGYTMSGQGLDLYKPIYDSDGAVKYNADNQAMYTGPGGIPIPETELPPENERGVKEWSFKTENPLFFAFRELPNDAWQRLQKKKECYVFVVWGDVKPRAPECAEFNSASFVAEKVDDQSVKVEVTVDSDSKTLEIPFETTQKIVMGNRIMLWINVKKEEEGATIRFNSLAVGELFEKK